jgi:hypothetical protein
VILVWPDVDQTPDEVHALLDPLKSPLVIAKWTPADDDRGRTALLASLRDAREAIASGGGNPDSLDIVGFGLGAVAVAGLTRYAKRLGIGLGRAVCVAPRWDEPDPFSGAPLQEVPERVEPVPDARDIARVW